MAGNSWGWLPLWSRRVQAAGFGTKESDGGESKDFVAASPGRNPESRSPSITLQNRTVIKQHTANSRDFPWKPLNFRCCFTNPLHQRVYLNGQTREVKRNQKK